MQRGRPSAPARAFRARRPTPGRARASPRSRSQHEGHDDRVHVLACAAVVGAAVALALEAVALVQADRRLVVREDVELELLHAALAGPLDGGVEQRAPDPAAAVRRGHHQAEVGDVVARRVLVARDREAADDAALVLGDVDGGVRVAAERAEVATLVADAPPAVRGDEPALRLVADLRPECDECGRVAGLGLADRRRHASTTTPWPPRRGSPAAASVPSSRTSTAAAPPK